MSGQPIDDNEVRRKFQQLGDVKEVRPAGEREEYGFPQPCDICLILYTVSVMLNFTTRGCVPQSILISMFLPSSRPVKKLTTGYAIKASRTV